MVQHDVRVQARVQSRTERDSPQWSSFRSFHAARVKSVARRTSAIGPQRSRGCVRPAQSAKSGHHSAGRAYQAATKRTGRSVNRFACIGRVRYATTNMATQHMALIEKQAANPPV